jgi:hypothetical protein
MILVVDPFGGLTFISSQIVGVTESRLYMNQCVVQKILDSIDKSWCTTKLEKLGLQ